MDSLSTFLQVDGFLELHYYAFGLRDPCPERHSYMDFQNAEKTQRRSPPHACFATHVTKYGTVVAKEMAS